MSALDDTALETAQDRGTNLLPGELLLFVEQFDDAVDRGVPLERLEAYADALAEGEAGPFGPDELHSLVEMDLTDAEEWEEPDSIYRVGDGLSAFPPAWHDQLGGEEDLARYVQVISADLASGEKHTAGGAAGQGVPEQLLIDAATALGPFSRSSARAELQELRDDGVLVEGADQHPEARVMLAEEETAKD